ncbi:MAG: GNAT family N-acetyltransferase [Armatimonas sp.]
MNREDISIQEITSLHDPLFVGFLNIYQKSFPLDQQMLVSFFINMLRDKESGKAEQFRLDVLATDKQVVGFAFYEIEQDAPSESRGAYLWYIATDPDVRGQGFGGVLYQQVVHTVFEHFGCRLLCFEIEIEEEACQRYGQKAAAFAAWRRGWYKQQGARELLGTYHLSGVGWHPAIPMQVMIHSNGGISPEEALAIAFRLQDESIDEVGELKLC